MASEPKKALNQPWRWIEDPERRLRMGTSEIERHLRGILADIKHMPDACLATMIAMRANAALNSLKSGEVVVVDNGRLAKVLAVVAGGGVCVGPASPNYSHCDAKRGTREPRGRDCYTCWEAYLRGEDGEGTDEI